MTTRTALALLVLGFAGCAHRYPADAGGNREAVAGLSVQFGERRAPLPPDTEVSWDFGDGARAQGPTAEHAFARPGTYEVCATVRDPRGERTDSARLIVVRRPVAAAVPPGAQIALVFERLFARLPNHLALAERLFGPDDTRSLIAALRRTTGVDLTRPEELLKAGIDPDKGFAVARFADDASPWFVVGVSDEAAALVTAQLAVNQRFARVETSSGGPQVWRAESGDSVMEMLAFGGYLYLRISRDDYLPIDPTRVTNADPQGLFANAEFAKLRASLTGDDGFGYFARAQTSAQGPSLLQSPLAPDAIGVALQVTEAGIDLDALVLDEGKGWELAPSWSELARRAPPGATAFAALGNTREKLRSFAATASSAMQLPASRDEQATNALLAAIKPQLSFAVYVDPVELLEDLSSGGAPARQPQFLALAPLADPAAVRGVLDQGAKRNGDQWRLDSTPASAAALTGDLLLVGTPALLQRAQAPASGRTLEAELREKLPADALQPGHQLIYVDVAGTLDRLRAADGVRSRLAAGVVEMTLQRNFALRPVTAVRDVLVDAWSGKRGISARVHVRLR